MIMRKFVVVGSGISGLSTAFHIFKKFPTCSITLLEKNSYVGGSIKTTKVNDFYCEEGPRSIRNSKYSFYLGQIIQEIGLNDKIVPSKTLPYTYIYWAGKLRHIPQTLTWETFNQFRQDNLQSIKPLAKTILNAIKKKRSLAKSIQNKDMSIYDFLQQLTDDDENVTVKFAETIFYGIYGTSIRNISARLALFKDHLKYFNLDTIPKNQLPPYKSYRFTEGVGMLPITINEFLQKKTNYKIKLNSGLDDIDLDKKEILSNGERIPFDDLVLTVPAHELKDVFSKRSKTEDSARQSILIEVNLLLQGIKTSGLLSRNLCYGRPIIPGNFKGFGYLVNPNQNQKLVGMVNDSMLFPSMKSQFGECISLMALPENEAPIFEYVDELYKHLGIDKVGDPDFVLEKNWFNQFPIYEPGHMDRAQRLIMLMDKLKCGVQIGGTTLFASAIPELVMQSKFLVDKL